MDPYSSPYITHYSTFGLYFPFLHSQLTKGKIIPTTSLPPHSLRTRSRYTKSGLTDFIRSARYLTLGYLGRKEWKNEHGTYYNEVYRDYYKDPFLNPKPKKPQPIMGYYKDLFLHC